MKDLVISKNSLVNLTNIRYLVPVNWLVMLTFTALFHNHYTHKHMMTLMHITNTQADIHTYQQINLQQQSSSCPPLN